MKLNKVEPANKSCKTTLERLREFKGIHKIAVGLSGGVDSSLTAALLVEAGWEVKGLTLWLISGQGSCCSDGLIDAAGICEQLDIPHHVIDKRSKFEDKVVKTIVKGYEEGITPLPCSLCNRSVKFSEMINWAENNQKIPFIATGHYARIRYSDEVFNASILPGNSKGREKLLRGKDQVKDQSYFLYDLSQEVLAKTIFPLGELNKQETRIEAERFGLRTAKKKESQDLCLAEHYGSMKTFLNNYIKPKPGEIVFKDGTVVGQHDGIEHFTIGQRKGLGVSWKEPLHVIQIESKSNKVIVAPRHESGQTKCTVGSINWVSIHPPEKTIDVEIQIRYRSKAVKGKLKPIKETEKDIINNRPYRCQITFEEEQFSITPGQAAVFYKGEILLGGGLIENI